MKLSEPPVPAAPVYLHRDDTILVLAKPAGMLAVPGRGDDKQDCLAARVQVDHPDALVVHRLDMATSGVMIMARGAAAQRALSGQFMQRRVAKRYLAIVAGRPTPAAGEIDLPLAADWPNRPRQKVDRVLGKPSLTRYSTVAYDAVAGASRLELEPVTGRTHQLRVHLYAIGHPIVGDRLYGPAAPSADRLLLHASWLSLAHPATGEPMQWHCPPPF